MKIKQIELIGFKSFSEKTVLPLHEGITCIVGPNGCGKSNIVDAFRWVLGEQSAKSLRGDKMEEVIFQGSSTKKPKGMAEVALTMTLTTGLKIDDNGSDPNSKNEDSIFLARRLYRSGESEYILNKKVCRLKDIRDILLDTGLDVRSYSILDQHRISEIVNSKPQDRRFLIEEIAGVMKYKVRKAEAQSKLESARQNLMRINDIVVERRRQIGSLDRQVKKAERYKTLLEEAKAIELRISRHKHLLILEELRGLEEELKHIESQETSKRAQLSEIQNKVETLRIRLAEWQNILSQLEQDLQSHQSSLARAEKQSAVLKTQIENKKYEVSRMTQQIEENHSKITALKEKASSNEELIATLEKSLSDIKDKLTKKGKVIGELNGELKRTEQTSEDLKKELFKLSDDISTKRNTLNKRHSHIDNLQYRQEITRRDREGLQRGIDHIVKTIGSIEEGLQQINRELLKLQQQRQSLEGLRQSKEHELTVLRQSLSSEREGLASDTSRLQSLRELFADSPTVSALKGRLSQILKPLSDTVEVDAGYETAIEAVLSEKISSYIVENPSDLKEVLGYMNDNPATRTTFLYLPQQRFEEIHHSVPEDIEILGRASDYIRPLGDTEKGVSTAIKGLLADTFIIENLQSALDYLEKKPDSRFNFVTPKGELLSHGGWITLGKGTEVLRFKREQRDLENSIKKRHAKIAELEQAISDLSTSIKELKESSSSIQSQITELEKRLLLTRHNLEEAQKDLQRKQRRLESLEVENQTLQSEKEAVQREIDGLSEEIRQKELQRSQIQDAINDIQKRVNSIRQQIQAEQKVETEIRLQEASFVERLESLRKEHKALKNSVEELSRQTDGLSKNKERTLRLIEEETAQVQGLELEIRQEVETITRLSSEYQAKKEVISEDYDGIKSYETSMTQLRSEVDELSTRASDLKTKAFEKRLLLENLENSIKEKYEVDLQDIHLDREVTEEDNLRLTEIQQKLRDLGPVNLESITEYEELKKDYDFMLRQQEDLNLSITELEEAINRINLTTKRRLREAYNALRERFNEVFSTLFGGGKADLILTDEENILESGLEIVAQPPGKKNQNLNQLSGGEKALTSLALLFAGFLIKPSPLCILDEADAPLDESNTERFANMIKRLSKDTQFIIITHNRVTMEVADYLYGVTMEEPGVSKTISLQFAEYEKTLNQN